MAQKPSNNLEEKIKTSPFFTEDAGHFLYRYRDIVDDWEHFRASVLSPLPTSIWVNPSRTTRQVLKEWFERHNMQVEEQLWNTIGLNISGHENIGVGLPFLLGHYHIQEAVSMLPVIISDVAQARYALDLCAAPGNKTVLASMMMGDRGQIIANDRQMGRMQILKRAMGRLGLANISVTVQNAGHLQVPRDDFDTVFADVPCSCEGTIRKNQNLLFEMQSYSGSLISLQRFILKRAFELTRVGGQLIYSTCTFAPEENEGNVDWLITKYGAACKVLSVPRLPHFTWNPGLKEWQGQQYHDSIQNCIRIWPHHNDTGGFFMAVIEKVAEDA